MSKKSFEILCIDSKGCTVITNVDNLLNRLKGNGIIWKQAELNKNQISDEQLGIKLTSQVIEANQDNAKTSFLIKVEGGDELESFRLPLVKHLKDEKFDFIYILTDDISQEIGVRLYPKINQLENLLRKYLTIFFAAKLGPKWWDDIADGELNKKVQYRKNNETVFSTYKVNGKDETLVDTKSFRIDFDDLGEIIYKVSAGNLNSNDIIKQIEGLDETSKIEQLSKAVSELKNRTKTNIKKFFPDFEQIEFQRKWEFLYGIRNKVAHNGLLFQKDEDEACEYLKELTILLNSQNNKLGGQQFEQEEISAYQENIVKQSNRYAKISKSELAFELNKMDDWARKNKRPFIGLGYFVADILGIKGYDIKTSYGIISELEKDGYVETYLYTDPTGKHFSTPTAIKVKKSLKELFEIE